MNRIASLGALAVGVSVGCGGRTSGEGSPAGGASEVECEAVSACGGEIAGEWRVVGACTDLSYVKDALLGCAAAELVDSDSKLSGTADFRRDGSYFLDITYAGSVSVAVPERCYELRASRDPCGDLARGLEQRGELLLDSARCFPTETGCFCQLEQRPFERLRSGDYTTRAGVVSESEGERREYCVEDDRLWLSVGDTVEGDTIVFARAR